VADDEPTAWLLEPVDPPWPTETLRLRPRVGIAEPASCRALEHPDRGGRFEHDDERLAGRVVEKHVDHVGVQGAANQARRGVEGGPSPVSGAMASTSSSAP
jgi:hypothetical protein